MHIFECYEDKLNEAKRKLKQIGASNISVYDASKVKTYTDKVPD